MQATTTAPAARSQHAHRRRGGSTPHTRPQGLLPLSVIAVILTGYSAVAGWLREHDYTPLALEAVDTFITQPLLLNDNLEFFGAALLLLIAGFFIADAVAGGADPRGALRHTLRVIALVWAMTVVAWSAAAAGVGSTGTAVDRDDLTGALLLLPLVDDAYPALLPQSWILLPILTAIAFGAVLLPVFRREPWAAIAVQAAAYSIVLSIVSPLDGPFASSIGTSAAFGTVLALGQAVWLVRTGRAPLWAGSLLGVACWVAFCWGEALGYGRHDVAYPLTLAYATLMLVIAVQVKATVASPTLVRHLSARCYSLYILTPTAVVILLPSLINHLPAGLSAALSVVIVLVAAEVLYRLVDRPAAALPSLFARTTERAGNRR